MAGLPAGDDFPTGFQVARWQAELRGVNIHRAEGQKSERRAAAGDSVDHFIHSAVAARRDDVTKSVPYCSPRESLRFTGPGGEKQRGAARDGFDAILQSARALTAGGRIQDDGGAFHNALVEAFSLFIKLSQRNVPT